MNLLFIWDGAKDLPAERLENINACLTLYPDTTYYCITRLPFFCSDKINIISWDKYEQEISDHFKYPKTFPNLFIFTEWARFWFLANNPNTLYIDTDVKLLQYYDYESSDKYIHTDFDINLLYSPKQGMPNLITNMEKNKTYCRLRLRDFIDGYKNPQSRDYYHHWA